MSQREDDSRFDRRSFMKATGGAAAMGLLAGCSGGGDDPSSGAVAEDGEIIMQTADSSTLAYAMSEGLGQLLSEQSDSLDVQPRPSEGTNANVRDLSNDDAQMVYLQNWTANKVANNEGAFAELKFTPYQVFHLYDLGWFFGTSGNNWETVSDIESGSSISPTPTGSGTAPMLERVLDIVIGGDNYERADVRYSEQGSTLNDGTLDVGVGTFVNFSIEPGWLEDMKSTAGLRLLGYEEESLQAIRDEPGITLTEVDMGDFEGYAYTPNPLPQLTLAYNFVVRNNFDYDTMMEFLNGMWDNRDSLSDQHPVLGTLSDGEFWVKNAYDGLPFHPAAYDFYEEKGLLKDGFERGEEV